MEVKVGDLIKYQGHICKVRYVCKDPHPNYSTMIEFDTPNYREYKSVNEVQFPPFKNDNDNTEFRTF